MLTRSVEVELLPLAWKMHGRSSLIPTWAYTNYNHPTSVSILYLDKKIVIWVCIVLKYSPNLTLWQPALRDHPCIAHCNLARLRDHLS